MTLITNSKSAIEPMLDKIISIEEVTFTLDVPNEVRHYSAHYKIEVLQYLSTKQLEYSILVDNDIICIGDVPEILNLAVQNGIPMYYDITNQNYPTIGLARQINDKSLIMGQFSVGNWIGGEFIGGTSTFYNLLYNESMKIYPTYCANFRNVHHQGDEMVVSCALEKILRNGTFAIEAGSYDTISRYWGTPAPFFERKFESLKNVFLLHLPGRKRFLANLDINKNCIEQLNKLHKQEKWEASLIGRKIKHFKRRFNLLPK